MATAVEPKKVGPKPSPVFYKKTTLKSDYMKFPANAIAVGRVGDNKGKLILACGALDRIIVLDPDTGQVMKEYGPEVGTGGALDDVREGPDGTLYFTHLGKFHIGYVRPDGTFGKIPAKIWNNSLCVTRDGKWLYYGLCIGDDQLWRQELEDGLPKKGVAPELVQQNPGWSNSMEAYDDGFIYSPLNMYGEVRKINAETKEITTLYKNLEFPSSCKINDATGILYTSEFHLGYISRIDLKIKDPVRAKRILAVAPPATDNVAVICGPKPRIFGSSFVEDWIFECYENGDPMRIIAKGGHLPFQIQVMKGANGDRILIRDLMRVREWFPAENRYETLAHATFWSYAQNKFFDHGHKRYDPERINWTSSFEDYLKIPCGKIFQPTAEGHFLVGGAMVETFGSRIVIFDIENRKALRTIDDLGDAHDAIMVGQDIYTITGPAENPNYDWPLKGVRILKVTPDDKQEVVFTGGTNLVAFATRHDIAFASDADTGIIYQVVQDGKWLPKPVQFVSGLKGPQGMTFANDGNLLVMENNEGHDGRMLKVDLKTKEVTVLAGGLGVNWKLNTRDWKVLFPISQAAQASDGSIYFTEPGTKSLSVLRAE